MAVRILNVITYYSIIAKRKTNLQFSIFRYLRNKKQRCDAREEQLRAVQSRVESQVFHTRCSHSPEVLTFHPFEPHLAVALKDYFGYLF